MKIEVLTKDELSELEKYVLFDQNNLEPCDLDWIYLVSPTLLETTEDGALTIRDCRLESLVGYNNYDIRCRVVDFGFGEIGVVAVYH